MMQREMNDPMSAARRVYARWGRHPTVYSAASWAVFLGHERELRRRAVEVMELDVGARVLDVGCGTGRNFEHILRTIPDHDLVQAMRDEFGDVRLVSPERGRDRDPANRAGEVRGRMGLVAERVPRVSVTIAGVSVTIAGVSVARLALARVPSPSLVSSTCRSPHPESTRHAASGRVIRRTGFDMTRSFLGHAIRSSP